MQSWHPILTTILTTNLDSQPKSCTRFTQGMPMIYPRYVQDMPMECPIYALDMSKICAPNEHFDVCRGMPKVCLRNAQDMPRYAKDMPLICPRYTLPLNILTTDLEKKLELCKRFWESRQNHTDLSYCNITLLSSHGPKNCRQSTISFQYLFARFARKDQIGDVDSRAE